MNWKMCNPHNALFFLLYVIIWSALLMPDKNVLYSLIRWGKVFFFFSFLYLYINLIISESSFIERARKYLSSLHLSVNRPSVDPLMLYKQSNYFAYQIHKRNIIIFFRQYRKSANYLLSSLICVQSVLENKLQLNLKMAAPGDFFKDTERLEGYWARANP